MKDMINYYYGLYAENITYCDNRYYIVANSGNYILKELADDIPYVDDYIVNQLEKYSYFLKIKKNINNNYITTISQKRYVLLKQGKYKNYRICLSDLKTDYYLNNDVSSQIKNHWIVLWENKIDIFEKTIYLKKEKYLEMIPIFNYYIGIGENAILYLKKTFNSEVNQRTRFVASRKRLNTNMTLYDYYDPTNVIIDYACRDIAEYTKSMIIEEIFDIEEFEKYLSKIRFSTFELKLLFARLLFPTFFFDYIESKIEIDRDKLESHIKQYEDGLYNINKLLFDKYGIEKINWIYKNKTKY